MHFPVVVYLVYGLTNSSNPPSHTNPIPTLTHNTITLVFDSFRHLVIRLDWRSTPHVRYSALAELSLTASYPLLFQSAIPTCPSEKLYLLDLSVESLTIPHDFGSYLSQLPCVVVARTSPHPSI